MTVLPKIFPHGSDDQKAKLKRQVLRRSAEIGGQLFGPVPKDRHRQFFCLDEHTWVWHEEWQDHGKRRAVTTRYEIRPAGILKVQDGQVYQRLSRDETRNLYQAARLYRQRVGDYYRQLLQTA